MYMRSPGGSSLRPIPPDYGGTALTVPFEESPSARRRDPASDSEANGPRAGDPAREPSPEQGTETPREAGRRPRRARPGGAPRPADRTEARRPVVETRPIRGRRDPLGVPPFGLAAPEDRFEPDREEDRVFPEAGPPREEDREPERSWEPEDRPAPPHGPPEEERGPRPPEHGGPIGELFHPSHLRQDDLLLLGLMLFLLQDGGGGGDSREALLLLAVLYLAGM